MPVRNLIFVFLLFTAPLCMAQPAEKINYVPLGDSYTIGTGTDAEHAFPAVLTAHLNEKGLAVKLLANPAVNGFTTQDVLDVEMPVFLKQRVDFTTLLIGVNDWVSGMPERMFARNLALILDQVQQHLTHKNNIVLITIPDFSVTPQGAYFNRNGTATAGIQAYNAIIKREAALRKLAVADIFEISKSMGSDASLVAQDGLHPSAKGYKVWEEVIVPVAAKVLGK